MKPWNHNQGLMQLETCNLFLLLPAISKTGKILLLASESNLLGGIFVRKHLTISIATSTTTTTPPSDDYKPQYVGFMPQLRYRTIYIAMGHPWPWTTIENRLFSRYDKDFKRTLATVVHKNVRQLKIRTLNKIYVELVDSSIPVSLDRSTPDKLVLGSNPTDRSMVFNIWHSRYTCCGYNAGRNRAFFFPLWLFPTFAFPLHATTTNYASRHQPDVIRAVASKGQLKGPMALKVSRIFDQGGCLVSFRFLRVADVNEHYKSDEQKNQTNKLSYTSSYNQEV
jgi:hypothetical protein